MRLEAVEVQWKVLLVSYGLSVVLYGSYQLTPRSSGGCEVNGRKERVKAVEARASQLESIRCRQSETLTQNGRSGALLHL